MFAGKVRAAPYLRSVVLVRGHQASFRNQNCVLRYVFLAHLPQLPYPLLLSVDIRRGSHNREKVKFAFANIDRLSHNCQAVLLLTTFH